MNQLVIDCNPQSLEDSCRGVSTPSSTTNGGDNRLGEIFSRSDRRFPPSLNQLRSDPSTVPLFPPQPQTLFQFPLLNGCQPLPCRLPTRGVELQVQRSVVAKSETSFLVGQLIRRQPQVQKDSVNRPAGLSRLGKNVAEFGITGLVEAAARMVENQPGFFEHRAVTIQAHKTTVRTEIGENP